MILGCFTVNAIVIAIVESWALLDGFYFTIVTASTIGFGDIVPTTVRTGASAKIH